MLTLSFEQFQELLVQNTTKAEEENLPEGIYHSSYNTTLNTQFCKGYVQNVSIREGITLIKLQLTFFQDTTIEMKSFLPQVGFWYCLKGQVKGYRENITPKENSSLDYSFSSNIGCVYATDASQGWMQPQKDKLYKAIYLLFSYPVFKELIGEQVDSMPKEFIEALEEKNGYYMTFMSFPSQVKALCEAIFDNPYNGRSRQFYREAKVIELIAYQVDRLTKAIQELDSAGVKLTPKEEKLIEYCQQLLLSSLENPPSLIELSKEIGMSSYRLKNGFRQMYGVTPNRFIVDQRMIMARQLLLKKELTVSQVASAVGFASLGTFSNTFYEKFGIRPSDL